MPIETRQAHDSVGNETFPMYRLVCDNTGRTSRWFLNLEDSAIYLEREGFRLDGGRVIYEGPEDLHAYLRGEDLFYRMDRNEDGTWVRVPVTYDEYIHENPSGPLHTRARDLFTRVIARTINRYPCLVGEEGLEIHISFRRRPKETPPSELAPEVKVDRPGSPSRFERDPSI